MSDITFDGDELRLLHEAAVFMRLNNIQRHDAASSMGKGQEQLDYFRSKAERFEALEMRLFEVINPDGYGERETASKGDG